MTRRFLPKFFLLPYGTLPNGKAFIGFVTAGDPTLEKTAELIITMANSGADLVEIGIPFSDPIAEGVGIQNANIRALANGATTDGIFAMVEKVRQKTQVPLVFLTYINPVLHYGYERFFARCQKVGIDGIICPDLPYEEKEEIAAFAACHQVDIISLIAPTSEDRIQKIAQEAQGFVYVVSSMGVTGMRSEIKTDLKSILQIVKQYAKVPTAVGFGINTPQQAHKIAQIADGVIVGSAIVKIIEQYGEASTEHVAAYVRSMKEAVSS